MIINDELTQIGASIGIDNVDRKLLAALHLDGRAAWGDIGHAAGCSASTAQRRYLAMHRRGLARVVGAVDMHAAGIGVPVIVRVRCGATRLADLIPVLQRRPEIRFLTTVTGTADCIAEIVVAAYEDLEWLVPELFPDSAWSTEALPVMRTFTSAHDWSPFGNATGRADGVSAAPVAGRPVPLSETERIIASMLMSDGRTPLTDLAAAAGKSKSTAGRVLDGLLASGRLRIRTLVEPPLLGYTTEFMVWISIAPEHLDDAATALARHPAAKYLSATVGRYNLAGQMLLADYSELYEFTTRVLGELPGIREVDVTLQLTTHKRLWTPIDGVTIADRATR